MTIPPHVLLLFLTSQLQLEELKVKAATMVMSLRGAEALSDKLSAAQDEVWGLQCILLCQVHSKNSSCFCCTMLQGSYWVGSRR